MNKPEDPEALDELDAAGEPDNGPAAIPELITFDYSNRLVLPGDADPDSLEPIDQQFTIVHLLAGVIGAASLFCIVFAVVTKNGGSIVLALVMSTATALLTLRLVRGSLADAEARVVDELGRGLDRTPSRQLKPAILTLKGERLLWETRLHPLSIAKWWVALFAAPIGAVVLGVKTGDWQISSIGWAVIMVPISIKIYEWWHSTVGVTDRRLIAVQGIVNIKRPMMPLAKLTDEGLFIPATSRILARLRIIKTKYGSLIVESAGQDQALSRIDFFPAIEPVNQIIAGQAVPRSNDGS